MSQIVESLEKSLCIWEDLCLLVNLLTKFQLAERLKPDYQLNGPFVHYHEFRQFLLKCGREFDNLKFGQYFLEEYKPDKPPALGDLAHLALDLASWACNSRRVYHLTSEIQLLLNATSINNITWQYVKLPLSCFTILLDEPIIGTEFAVEYDCLIVNSYSSPVGIEEIEFRLIPTHIRNYQPISEDEKKLMEKFLQQKKWPRLLQRIEKYNNLIPMPILFPNFTVPLTPNALESKVTASIIELAKEYMILAKAKGHNVFLPPNVQEMPIEGSTATRIIVALCLYLTTKFGNQNRRYTYHPPGSKKNRPTNLITDKSDIFRIKTEHKLSDQEKIQYADGLKRGSFTVSPHFRSGTWRVPPGKANDPDAQKTIWVRPSLINAHLLQEGSLPNGIKITM